MAHIDTAQLQERLAFTMLHLYEVAKDPAVQKSGKEAAVDITQAWKSSHKFIGEALNASRRIRFTPHV